jgi:hypothetical protein
VDGLDGVGVDGLNVGKLVASVGAFVGERVGAFVGERVGAFVGERVGAFVGERVGAFVGERVGAFVGERVGPLVPCSSNSVAMSEIGRAPLRAKTARRMATRNMALVRYAKKEVVSGTTRTGLITTCPKVLLILLPTQLLSIHNRSVHVRRRVPLSLVPAAKAMETGLASMK